MRLKESVVRRGRKAIGRKPLARRTRDLGKLNGARRGVEVRGGGQDGWRFTAG